jgi:hypothetical protein
VFDEIFMKQEQSALARLRNGAEMLYFLQSNKNVDMEDLQKISRLERQADSR